MHEESLLMKLKLLLFVVKYHYKCYVYLLIT